MTNAKRISPTIVAGHHFPHRIYEADNQNKEKQEKSESRAFAHRGKRRALGYNRKFLNSDGHGFNFCFGPRNKLPRFRTLHATQCMRLADQSTEFLDIQFTSLLR